MPEFIIVMRDDHYSLIGPFADEDVRDAWATAHWIDPDSVPGAIFDPRWQSINLANPHAAPVVLDPADPAAIAAIQE
jgi:hypothetical protein